MNEWIDELSDICAADEPAVLVSVAGIRGSAPREMGAKMIVTARDTIGTIGGGQLEYQCTRVAVGKLQARASSLRSFPLGASMGQCCGGVVEILFEPMGGGMPDWLRDLKALHGQREAAILLTRISKNAPMKFVVTANRVFGIDENTVPSRLVTKARSILEGNRQPYRNVQEFYEPVVVPDLNIAVFGAGHVGTAIIDTLSTLDCNIRWVDSRRSIFRHVPANVRAIEASDPSLEVAAMPAGSYYLVMTHSHALDFDICDRILRRGDARYCGLIGSRSKRRRFEKRYRQQGMPQALIDDSLTCPIGVGGISGKKPAEIAVATAAEILEVHGKVAAGPIPVFPDNVHPIY
ncbi:MAG: xanthine dehydrogenase accessory protein XdhC [Woeseiaceae bacterium]